MNKTIMAVLLFVVAFGLFGCLGAPQMPVTNGTTPTPGTNPGTVTPPTSGSVDKVTVDFLYADWCPHCQNMKPIVADLIKTLPADKFQVNYWSEDDYKAGGPAAQVFTKYANMGMFQGYPTFVINGGTAYTAGEMPATEFKNWICSQYTVKPTGC
jgi:thiol-disulfide isomerase/thioredoxin